MCNGWLQNNQTGRWGLHFYWMRRRYSGWCCFITAPGSAVRRVTVCVEFLMFPSVCVGFLHVLLFPSLSQILSSIGKLAALELPLSLSLSQSTYSKDTREPGRNPVFMCTGDHFSHSKLIQSDSTACNINIAIRIKYPFTCAIFWAKPLSVFLFALLKCSFRYV